MGEPSSAIPTIVSCVQSGRYAEALALIESAHRTVTDVEDRKWLYDLQMRCLAKTSDWTRLRQAGEQAVAGFPEFSEAYGYLGEALIRLGKAAEARAVLAKAVALNPRLLEARALLRYAEGELSPIRTRKVRGWPGRQSKFADPKRLVERYLTDNLVVEPFIDRGTRFLALGSCFAAELSLALIKRGFRSHHERFGEDFNSTFANLHLLRWCVHGPGDEITAYLEAVLGPPMRLRLFEALKRANCVVVTLGLAAAHFHDLDGSFGLCIDKSVTSREMFYSNYSLKTSTVAQNVANLEAIVELVDEVAGPDCRIVLSVSPVPMAGTTEFESAVLSDCISKSTLRLASHEFLSSCRRPGIYYWPSFEMVKWLGAHFPRSIEPAFGADDGETRHVSYWLVGMIIEMFVEKFSKPSPAAVGSDHPLAV